MLPGGVQCARPILHIVHRKSHNPRSSHNFMDDDMYCDRRDVDYLGIATGRADHENVYETQGYVGQSQVPDCTHDID